MVSGILATLAPPSDHLQVPSHRQLFTRVRCRQDWCSRSLGAARRLLLVAIPAHLPIARLRSKQICSICHFHRRHVLFASLAPDQRFVAGFERSE